MNCAPKSDWLIERGVKADKCEHAGLQPSHDFVRFRFSQVVVFDMLSISIDSPHFCCTFIVILYLQANAFRLSFHIIRVERRLFPHKTSPFKIRPSFPTPSSFPPTRTTSPRRYLIWSRQYRRSSRLRPRMS